MAQCMLNMVGVIVELPRRMEKEFFIIASLRKGQEPVTMSGSNQTVLTEVVAGGCTWCGYGFVALTHFPSRARCCTWKSCVHD